MSECYSSILRLLQQILTCSVYVTWHSILFLVESAGGGLTETLADTGDEALGLFLIVHLLFLHGKPFEEPRWQNDLDNNTPDESEETKAEADSLISVGQWSGSEWATTILNHAVLNHEAENHDDDEPSVVAEAFEDVVVLVTELTSIDLVEELHEDEALEDNGVELALLCSGVEERLPF